MKRLLLAVPLLALSCMLSANEAQTSFGDSSWQFKTPDKTWVNIERLRLRLDEKHREDVPDYITNINVEASEPDYTVIENHLYTEDTGTGDVNVNVDVGPVNVNNNIDNSSSSSSSAEASSTSSATAESNATHKSTHKHPKKPKCYKCKKVKKKKHKHYKGCGHTKYAKRKGNNGIGNGLDPAPPGNPKKNDTPKRVRDHAKKGAAK